MATTPSWWPGCCWPDELKPIAVPAPAGAAARELVRARDAVPRQLMTARQRASKLLLRQGRVDPEASTRTGVSPPSCRDGGA